ncbi:Hypothetical protein MVR_LOCUS112 [uncultured virus]|nr:Hypothetical protein MVR_LOCUS112 [uncultured virus]
MVECTCLLSNRAFTTNGNDHEQYTIPFKLSGDATQVSYIIAELVGADVGLHAVIRQTKIQVINQAFIMQVKVANKIGQWNCSLQVGCYDRASNHLMSCSLELDQFETVHEWSANYTIAIDPLEKAYPTQRWNGNCRQSCSNTRHAISLIVQVEFNCNMTKRLLRSLPSWIGLDAPIAGTFSNPVIKCHDMDYQLNKLIWVHDSNPDAIMSNVITAKSHIYYDQSCLYNGVWDNSIKQNIIRLGFGKATKLHYLSEMLQCQSITCKSISDGVALLPVINAVIGDANGVTQDGIKWVNLDNELVLCANATYDKSIRLEFLDVNKAMNKQPHCNCEVVLCCNESVFQDAKLVVGNVKLNTNESNNKTITCPISFKTTNTVLDQVASLAIYISLFDRDTNAILYRSIINTGLLVHDPVDLVKEVVVPLDTIQYANSAFVSNCTIGFDMRTCLSFASLNQCCVTIDQLDAALMSQSQSPYTISRMPFSLCKIGMDCYGFQVSGFTNAIGHIYNSANVKYIIKINDTTVPSSKIATCNGMIKLLNDIRWITTPSNCIVLPTKTTQVVYEFNAYGIDLTRDEIELESITSKSQVGIALDRIAITANNRFQVYVMVSSQADQVGVLEVAFHFIVQSCVTADQWQSFTIETKLPVVQDHDVAAKLVSFQLSPIPINSSTWYVSNAYQFEFDIEDHKPIQLSNGYTAIIPIPNKITQDTLLSHVIVGNLTLHQVNHYHDKLTIIATLESDAPKLIIKLPMFQDVSLVDVLALSNITIARHTVGLKLDGFGNEAPSFSSDCTYKFKASVISDQPYAHATVQPNQLVDITNKSFEFDAVTTSHLLTWNLSFYDDELTCTSAEDYSYYINMASDAAWLINIISSINRIIVGRLVKLHQNTYPLNSSNISISAITSNDEVQAIIHDTLEFAIQVPSSSSHVRIVAQSIATNTIIATKDVTMTDLINDIDVTVSVQAPSHIILQRLTCYEFSFNMATVNSNASVPTSIDIIMLNPNASRWITSGIVTCSNQLINRATQASSNTAIGNYGFAWKIKTTDTPVTWDLPLMFLFNIHDQHHEMVYSNVHSYLGTNTIETAGTDVALDGVAIVNGVFKIQDTCKFTFKYNNQASIKLDLADYTLVSACNCTSSHGWVGISCNKSVTSQHSNGQLDIKFISNSNSGKWIQPTQPNACKCYLINSSSSTSRTKRLIKFELPPLCCMLSQASAVTMPAFCVYQNTQVKVAKHGNISILPIKHLLVNDKVYVGNRTVSSVKRIDKYKINSNTSLCYIDRDAIGMACPNEVLIFTSDVLKISNIEDLIKMDGQVPVKIKQINQDRIKVYAEDYVYHIELDQDVNDRIFNRVLVNTSHVHSKTANITTANSDLANTSHANSNTTAH